MNKAGKSLPNGLLIDLDGTMYYGIHPVQGAPQLIDALNAAALPHLFVTNNSSATAHDVAHRLQGMGIAATPEQVVTSAQAAAAFIAEQCTGAKVYVIGEHGLQQAVLDAGLRLVQEEAQFVLQGIDRAFTYEKLTKAVRMLLSGSQYVLTNPDLLLPSTDGLLPGAGSLSAMVKAASAVEPTVIGKPSAILVNFALARLGLKAEQTWMVGDNMATDIAAGINSGCSTALVLTGLTTKANLSVMTERARVEPDFIFEDLGQLQSYIIE